MIGDDLEVIAKEVSEFSSKYTHVITSGGIGPTHDDKTFEGTESSTYTYILIPAVYTWGEQKK